MSGRLWRLQLLGSLSWSHKLWSHIAPRMPSVVLSLSATHTVSAQQKGPLGSYRTWTHAAQTTASLKRVTEAAGPRRSPVHARKR